MKITREKLISMYQCFTRLSREKTAVRFHYSILKNKRLIEPEVMSLEETNKPLPEYEAWDKRRHELCNDFCDKDESGKPIVKQNNYVIPEDKREEFDAALESLKEENKDVFDQMEKRQEQFADLLKEEIEIDFVTLKLSALPQELLGAEVEILMDIIEED